MQKQQNFKALINDNWLHYVIVWAHVNIDYIMQIISDILHLLYCSKFNLKHIEIAMTKKYINQFDSLGINAYYKWLVQKTNVLKYLYQKKRIESTIKENNCEKTYYSSYIYFH